MCLRLLSCLTTLVRPLGEMFRHIFQNRQGNIALTFGLIAMPLLLGVGVSIDYVRAYNVRVKMQADLDAALIASVKKVDSLNEDQIKVQVGNWFAAQANDNQASYTLMLDTMVISKTNKSIQAVATGVVPTTFLGLANIPSIKVSVVTTVAGPATQYLNVYIVLDKSASMLLAATADGQAAMRTYAEGNCVFACHVSEGNSKPYNGKVYNTNYALAEAMGVQLRADVSVAATKQVLDLISASDPTQSRIKVGLYTIGSSATEVLSPTASMITAKNTLDDDARLTSATSQDTTHFDTSLAGLNKLVGDPGDGLTAGTPLKLVLMLTDGVQSERPWVTTNNPSNAWNCVSWVGQTCIKFRSSDFPYQTLTTPLNPAWCADITQTKNGKNVTMGVLYTEYLSIPLDWGYNGTVGDTMKSSSFKGTLHAGVNSSITRRDYIPYALQDCATDNMFLSAASPTEIEAGLAKIFQQYLGSVRLTQ
ncbi:MAG: transrane protein [Rhizobium sp.]|nr:transrane protein [Rhizobium sp.]